MDIPLCVIPWLARMCKYAKTGLKDGQTAKGIGNLAGSSYRWQLLPSAVRICIIYYAHEDSHIVAIERSRPCVCCDSRVMVVI